MPEMGAAHAIIQRQYNCHSLVQAFLANCFPTQRSCLSSRSWITLLATLPTEVKALELSSAAVSAAAIGRKFQDASLVKEGHNLYIQGLQQLQHALRDRNLVRNDGTLAACMALSLYEAMECPSGGSGAYFSHCEGILALVQARGVEAHSKGAGHQLFLGIRIPGILHALESHSSTFLIDSVWMQYPWEGKLKTPFTQIVDCLAQAPGILKRVHSLFGLHKKERTETCYTLIHECWHIDEKLDMMLHEMQQVTPHPLYWQVQSQMNPLSDSESLENLFPVAFHFIDLETANSIILLWAIRVMLWSGLCNLYRLVDSGSPILDSTTTSVLPSTSGLRKSLHPLGHRRDYIVIVHNVCQSVEYILRQETLLSGPLSVTPALGIVLESLRGQPHCWKEVAWLRAAIDIVRQRGLGLLKYAR
ncbi:C6 zinc finger domain-containing protein [Penicillium cataractarum]|uniref:C6 zinc finger domain-containing protein n=1 Tax=Penicillium cataractarum TaxID=2100454 RepID=A0A9W9RRH2_9EURO|nr:C6 zinc finger domain-containing protein [Penicillium cataractarum]KAJ5364335.1 C6 zinc finger domain-containing protein [Penicillium cataractarum]